MSIDVDVDFSPFAANACINNDDGDDGNRPLNSFSLEGGVVVRQDGAMDGAVLS